MQRVTNSPHSSSLPHIVCDWHPSTLSRLATEFSDFSSKPQTSFSAYHSYKAYFEPLLLAEISAELSSALDKYQRTSLRQPKLRARREEVGTTLAVVSVQKVTRVHTHGFGWAVDLDSHDKRGPVGCGDNDVVALWTSAPNQSVRKLRPSTTPRPIPSNAVLSVVVRSTTRTGCRVVLTKFPDGNENGVRMDLEEGEENEEEPPKVRAWNLLRLGSLTTMRREFHALQTIKNSSLLPKLLRPHLRTIEKESSESNLDASTKEQNSLEDTATAHRKQFHSEYFFTDIIASKTHLNPSQARAIIRASTCRDGFAVIQGPPGTGKTKTLIGLLNIIHMVQYQKYYESVLSAMDPLYGSSNRDRDIAKSNILRKEEPSGIKQKGTEGSLLKSMMVAMNKTVSSSAAALETKGIPLTRRAKRPRLLICAPSNSAVDEILTRLMKSKLLDGRGNSYCPELARIGAGDRVSESAKPFTAEGQAEAFLEEVCGEILKGEEQRKAQMAFLSKWQQKCNALLLQLERTPKKNTPASHAAVIELHEKLERMERDLRRLGIAASDKVLSREEKLRQIARTYVEDAQLVFATLSGSASNILTKKAVSDQGDQGGALFDTVIIDEAAQATETSSIIPMALGASRCILVGDPQQLPATVLSSGAAGLAYGQSLLERVVSAGQDTLLLDTQYRMHPAISSFPRRHFYNGRLVDDESVQGENRARPFHRDEIKPKLGPYVFLDISEGEERRSRDDRSICNPAEAELAALIYTKLKKDYGKEPLFSPAAKVHGSTIGFGVVTPYKRQMQELRQSFDRAGIPTGDVEIDTVDSFQGREKDVIVFSCVRTASTHRGIGFVRDVRRMNVGLTRARSSLVILGSAQALAEGSADWADLVEDANARGCLISVTSVARCLEPPTPLPSPSDQLEASKPSPPALIPPTTIAAEAGVSGAESYPRRNERRPQPSQRSDPRTRVNRKLASMSDTGQTGHGHTDGLQSHAPVAPAPPQHRNPVLPATGTAVPSNVGPGNQEVQESDANSGLQSPLEQMIKLLSDAGFKNTMELEHTLREHVQNGGQLDVETVMAAAIATGHIEATSQPAGEGAPAVYPAQTLSEPKVSGSEVDNRQALEAAKQENSNPETSDTGQDNKRRRETSEKSKHAHEKRSNSVPLKKAKKSMKERTEKLTAAAEPSGWDMLFGGSTASNGKPGEPPKNKPKNENASDGVEDIASTKIKAGEKIAPPDEKRADSSAATDEGSEGPEIRKLIPKDKSAESPRQSTKRRSNGQHERDEKKRTKGGAFSNRVDFRGGRASEKGRHSKRPRGPPQDLMDQGVTGAAGFGTENVWPQQVPYDPNMAGFQMMPTVMDQAMGGNAQAILPMQTMQQQAMQQQLMQHQALQQQAIQQQVIQHQLHQQAMQQEALRQQALMMHMSAAGMAHPGMNNAYPGVDFDNFNGGGVEAGTHNEGGTSWGYSNNNYGRRGRGRGRGRQKGGRGRRY